MTKKRREFIKERNLLRFLVKALVAIIISVITEVDGIIHVGYRSTEAIKVAGMTIGVNVTGPGSKATQYGADMLFDAYRVLRNTPDFGIHAHQILDRGGNAVIEASLVVADLRDVAFETLLHLQDTIEKTLLVVFRDIITIIVIWAGRDRKYNVVRRPKRNTPSTRYSSGRNRKPGHGSPLRIVLTLLRLLTIEVGVSRMDNRDFSDWHGLIMFYKGNFSDRDIVSDYSR